MTGKSGGHILVSMHYREDLRDSPESFLLLLPVHERIRLAEEMLNVGVLGWESRNNPYAEGEFVTTAWICVGRTQFSVDSLKDRLDVLSAASVTRMANSSPPSRARMSHYRKESLGTMAAPTSAQFPSWWPKVSLIRFRPSRSTNASKNVFAVR